MAMTIGVERVGDAQPIAIVSLSGELDASNYERLIDTARAEYDGGARGLVLDLAELSFMASSGLVALYSAARIFRGDPPPDPESGWQAIHDMDDESSHARNVRLAACQPAVVRVLERTGLVRLFDVDGTAAASVAALQGA
jgi:anti-anti-sigma factor